MGFSVVWMLDVGSKGAGIGDRGTGEGGGALVLVSCVLCCSEEKKEKSPPLPPSPPYKPFWKRKKLLTLLGGWLQGKDWHRTDT